MRRTNLGRFRFRKDDPLRDLHVPRSQRVDEDPDDGTDSGKDPFTGEPGTDDLDRDEIRNRGDVVSGEALG